jgi:17-hydroxy-3-oxo-4-pregnene-20-carboxyl-CoA lyase
MPRNRFCDQTAIAGIGWTEFTKNSGTTVLNLAAKASLAAIDDAGLSVRDIDGVVTYYWNPDTINPQQLIQALGIQVCHYEVYAQLGGEWCCGAVASAAMAVHAGLCENVLVYRALNGRSEKNSHRGAASGAAQFTAPYGVTHAAAKCGQTATAHMARFGTTSVDFGHLAITQRQHAILNQKAMMKTPISLEQHQTSRPIIYPYRLLDCCLRNDGAAALIVTSAERARDLRQPPVYIMAATAGHAPADHSWETNAVRAAPHLYGMAGISARDVSFAELYDPFTFMCMVHMEDFGLVPKGEVGGWVRAGENGLDGRVPVNTHGGSLSESYIQGLNHVVEAVQQLRPGGVVDDLCQGAHSYDRTMCRQIRNPNIALVGGEYGGSSLLLRRA